MAKQDFTIHEDTVRSGEDTPAEDKKDQPSNTEKKDKPVQLTEVKNANASGMGSMGRNTEEPSSIEIGK